MVLALGCGDSFLPGIATRPIWAIESYSKEFCENAKGKT
jgi:hypothetical protein